MANDTETELGALIAEFMRAEQCSAAMAEHAIVRVAQGLGLREVSGLLGVLRVIREETVAVPGQYAGLGIQRARILRGLYDLYVLCLTPGGQTACAAIVTNAAAMFPAPAEPGH